MKQNTLSERVRLFKLRNPGASIDDAKKMLRATLTEEDEHFLLGDWLSKNFEAEKNHKVK